MAHKIDYETLASNISDMVNVLEYDAMRSSGKAKMNSQHLHSLYFLLDMYTKQNKAAKKPAKSEG